MSDQFVAEIRIFAGNFAPTGWAFCDGQLLPISQNTALFSLLGTQYGGDGKSTFGLPNLQGSAPVHQGQGAGLSQYFVGESGGVQSVTLLQSEMPAHSHAAQAVSGADGNQLSPAGHVWSKARYGRQGAPMYSATGAQQMTPGAVPIVGESQPHNNLMPFLTLNFIIALVGIFPARS
jgi:microcystin-dependent protein